MAFSKKAERLCNGRLKYQGFIIADRLDPLPELDVSLDIYTFCFCRAAIATETDLGSNWLPCYVLQGISNGKKEQRSRKFFPIDFITRVFKSKPMGACYSCF